MTRTPLLIVGAAASLASCGTHTWATLDSTPEGARILVQGVNTGINTPAEVDLEAWAEDASRPMTVALRLDGYATSTTMPYPARHQCSEIFCPKKNRHTLSRTVPLFRRGTGLRIDARDAGFDVRIDNGPWIAVDDEALVPEAAAGVTLRAEPGTHVLGWRRRDSEERRRMPSSDTDIVIPEGGWLCVHLHRWPWGIPPRSRRNEHGKTTALNSALPAESPRAAKDRGQETSPSRGGRR